MRRRLTDIDKKEIYLKLRKLKEVDCYNFFVNDFNISKKEKLRNIIPSDRIRNIDIDKITLFDYIELRGGWDVVKYHFIDRTLIFHLTPREELWQKIQYKI